jgi:hypothetical protein
VPRRSIAEYTRPEVDKLRVRLEDARDTLRSGGRLLQSIARAYYVVYVIASFAAGKHGVRTTHLRGRNQIVGQDFRHTELPAVVFALYTGLKKDSIEDPGGSPGIGSGNYDEHKAYRHVNALVQLRFEADYGPARTVEPYGMAEADGWLRIAANLTQDLESIL